MDFDTYLDSDGFWVVAVIDPPHRTDITLGTYEHADEFIATFPKCDCHGPYEHRDFCMVVAAHQGEI